MVMGRLEAGPCRPLPNPPTLVHTCTHVACSPPPSTTTTYPCTHHHPTLHVCTAPLVGMPSKGPTMHPDEPPCVVHSPSGVGGGGSGWWVNPVKLGSHHVPALTIFRIIRGQQEGEAAPHRATSTIHKHPSTGNKAPRHPPAGGGRGPVAHPHPPPTPFPRASTGPRLQAAAPLPSGAP